MVIDSTYVHYTDTSRKTDSGEPQRYGRPNGQKALQPQHKISPGATIISPAATIISPAASISLLLAAGDMHVFISGCDLFSIAAPGRISVIPPVVVNIEAS